MFHVKHFIKDEFKCKDDCGELDIDPAIVVYLELMRRAWGKPIYVTSGRRCEAHNEKIGGVKNSNHTKGLAADIQIRGESTKTWHEFVNFVKRFCTPELRVLEYTTFLHIDVKDHPFSGKIYWEKDIEKQRQLGLPLNENQ